MTAPSVALLWARIETLEKRLHATEQERDCAIRALAGFAPAIENDPPPRRLQSV